VIILRADAGPSIGVGHVMRSLTLGSALVAAGADVLLVSDELPPFLEARAERLGVQAASSVPSGAFVVLDGYHLAAPDGRYAVIDDNREAPVDGAALVLNQNLHATAALYADLPAATRVLLGPEYALLREGLPRRSDPIRADVARVLVAMGGTDPAGLTAPIAESLTEYDVRVATAANFDALAEMFAWADIAVIAAGTTLWEVGYVGLPAVAIVVADNQRAAAKAADAAGFVVHANMAEVAAIVGTLDAARRSAMRDAGQALFDGGGAARVADAILAVAQ
jgi:spore coat polysaccharide biosynthesis predicted glycosyltransferase SpsG